MDRVACPGVAQYYPDTQGGTGRGLPYSSVVHTRMFQVTSSRQTNHPGRTSLQSGQYAGRPHLGGNRSYWNCSAFTIGATLLRMESGNVALGLRRLKNVFILTAKAEFVLLPSASAMRWTHCLQTSPIRATLFPSTTDRAGAIVQIVSRGHRRASLNRRACAQASGLKLPGWEILLQPVHRSPFERGTFPALWIQRGDVVWVFPRCIGRQRWKGSPHPSDNRGRPVMRREDR